MDGFISNEQLLALTEHRRACIRCAKVWEELNRTESILRFEMLEQENMDNDPETIFYQKRLTYQVIKSLPKLSWANMIKHWLLKYGIVVCGLLALGIFIGSTIVYAYENLSSNERMQVEGTDLKGIQMGSNTITIGQENTVHGDILLRHGTLQLDGIVNGNITIFDGEIKIGKKGYVSGEVHVIDGLLDWLKWVFDSWERG